MAVVQQKNPRWIEQLTKRLKKESTKEVAIGFPRGEESAAPHYDNGASILDVAIYNNFGTARIPRRPFMDNASTKLQKMWKKLLSQAQKRLNAGEISEETVMKTAALQGEAIVRAEIDAVDSPPNAPSTIAAKKSAKPLIDSGDMRKYVKGIVRAKS